MHAHAADNRGVTISARAGVLIGLLLAVVVILTGFSLVLGTDAVADNQTFPAWVDQRYAGEGPYRTVPTSPRAPNMIVVADAAGTLR